MNRPEGTEGVDSGVGAKRKASKYNTCNEGTDGTIGQSKTKNRKVGKYSANGIVSLYDVDILSTIASFMPPGKALMSICVVAGPVGAAHIRKEYLTDNDAYVSRSLENLTSRLAEPRAPRETTKLDKLDYPYGKIYANNASFDKCRDRILTWMQYNQWESRCTLSNVKRYSKLKPKRFHEANFPFNCMSFALALGLQDVVTFLVKEKEIKWDNTMSAWDRLVIGFMASTGVGLNYGFEYCAIRVALVRGDTAILDYMLTMLPQSAEYIPAAFMFALDTLVAAVSVRTFRFLAQHPKTKPNCDLLLFSVRELKVSLPYREVETNDDTVEDCKSRIFILVEAGADPFSQDGGMSSSPLQVAQSYLSCKTPFLTHKQIWKSVVDKMLSTKRA